MNRKPGDDHLSILSPRPRGPARTAYWQVHEAEEALVQRQEACFWDWSSCLSLVLLCLRWDGNRA
jgi:hypothetical protein